MNLLAHTQHRPWPLPRAPWLMTQTWQDLLFAHWQIEAQALAPLIPPGLTLDLFEGQAWVGVVPFRMSGVKLRGVLPIPTATVFPELNVRTYVVRDGKPGVFFFSLDAASRLAVIAGRRLYHLPYRHARMTAAESQGWTEYRSERAARDGARFQGRYRPTGDVRTAKPNTLEHWLTERYCLYSVTGKSVYRGEIHHLPWPLQPAQAVLAENTMCAPSGIALPDSAPLLHFARRLDVLAWPLVRA